MLAAGAATSVHAAGIINLSHVGAQMSAAGGGSGAPGAPNFGVSPQQALQASQPSIQNLARAAQGIAQQIAAQQAAAAAAAGAPSNVPNGLAVGGLQVAPGASSATSNSVLWINANLPTQSVAANGQTTVDVKQTAQNAVLTWQTMNVGKQTTLNFDQSGGTQANGANNWIVLNRIQDPSGAPSQILGNVTAQGTVLVINRNGILFGAGSQVNVHSLLASSLDLLNTNDDPVQSAGDIVNSNQLFLNLPGSANGGLAELEAGTSSTAPSNNGVANEILGLGNNISVASAGQYPVPGNITIAPGASITTSATDSASNGGFVLIAAPNVTNGGSITAAPTGQVILAAGVGVSLAPNGSDPQVLFPELTGKISLQSNSADITPAGILLNNGIVQSARGTIDLLGSTVVQNGVVGVTTSVNTPGNIMISTVDENIANTPTGTAYPGTGVPPNTPVTALNGGDATNRAGQLIFGNGSVTTVLPDTDGETATSAPGTVFTPGSITMTAGSVWFQSGSLVEAPGSTVSVAALTPSVALDATPPGDTAVQGRIYVDTGATIDVSGLADVELPISDILLDVGTINANNLADSPLLRDSFLNGLKGVIVDSTLSGTTSDGLQWVGSPILNLSGAVNLIPRTVDQLLTNGGTITLSGNEVMTADGSSLNLNGGYIHYLGGMVDTTRLIDASGAIVPIGQASQQDTYVGIAGEFVENHPRWGVTNDWLNPLLSGGAFEADYIVGGNAGTLNVFASQDMVLDGDITAEAFGGSKQVQGNDQPVGGSFNLGAAALVALTQGINASTAGESGTVILQDSAPQLSSLSPTSGAAFGADTPLDTAALGALSSTDPDNVLKNTVVPVNTLNSGGFANVSVNEAAAGSGGIVVAAGTQLVVQPGGSIKFVSPGGDVTVLGSLIAPSGNISISSGGAGGVVGGEIVAGPDALISVAGQWVNNDTQTAADTTPGDSEYINGGSITLSTALASSAAAGSSSQQITDQSGSIVLQAGSVLDVSSGGELQANGQMLMQNGIPEGTAGSLSLITYATNTTNPYGFSGGPLLPNAQPIAGQIEMDGTINSFGFAGGGTLTLQATGFQIGGDPAQVAAGDLYLPTDFFERQGFGKYVLNALYDVTIAPGATVPLTQQNLIANTPALQQAASGADLMAGGLTTLGTLDPYHRQATDLVMTGGAYLAWQSASGRPQYAGVTGGVTEGEGAAIVGDAGASIGLGSPAQVTVLGSIIAPGGSITLSADSIQNGFALPGQEGGTGDAGFNGFTSPTKSVWLGSDAVLDVAGVALTNPLAAPVKERSQTVIPDTGKVLAGGSVTISDDSGYVVAQAGSRIDVSGMSATFDELQPTGQFAPQQVWSDAGSITLGASSGLFFDGTLQAQPGAAQAQGGTLTILPEQVPAGASLGAANPGAQILILRQSGDLVPAGLMPGQNILAAVGGADGEPTGVLQFAADRLSGSGIATLEIGGDTAINEGNIPTPVPVAFAGNVNLSLPNAVEINTGQIVALSTDEASKLEQGAIDPTTGTPGTPYTLTALLNADSPATIGTTVTIDAPYVAIVGPTIKTNSAAFKALDVVADSSLNINASFIDLENQLQLNNFGQANFTSSGDIRLTSTNAVLTGGTNALVPGELYTPGNLTFQAADLYPSTGSTFILDAVGPADTTITFLGNGASSVPLSAGGTLLVDATNIVQSGTVRAPSGSLVFGVGDPTDTTTQSQFNELPLVATNSVSLTDGSVTSVSLDGAIVPFGTTVDGVEWQFNPVPGNNPAPDVTAPPAKFVSVNGNSVSLNAGATIDLSGGGDLQAEEWVPGTGGTRDLLSQYNVSFAASSSGVAVPVNVGGGNVYAILPGAQSPVAAYDPVFAQTLQPSTNPNGSASTTTKSIGVGSAALNSAVGESVYLSGVPGLPAGFYTLLPAKYATLPGAYRVTVSSDTGAVTPGASQTLPDGTVAVAGYLGNALDGSRSTTPTLFDVQSGAVWQQYSQYTLTSANSFFPPLAASAGNVTPPLPMDGGQLVLAATQGLTLGATLKTAAAAGGAPAEVDIASQAIQIVGNGEAALPGYLQISADQLDALDAGSLLIGGKRTQTSSGITIDPIATSVVVSNDAADPLTGPEVILVSANTLQVDSGSVIAAQGSYPAAKDQPITIGQVANSTTGAPAVSGDGALLSVSNGGDSVVTRLDTSGTGSLTVGAGAVLSGGQALTLDSSGNLTFDPAATLSGNTIAVDGSAITFTNQTGAAAASLPGFVVGATQLAQLANAKDVILRSAGAINFDGNVDATFGNEVDLSAGSFVSDGGAVTLNAKQVAFTNETGAPVPVGAAGSGMLTVNADEIDFGAGDKTVSGFGSASFNASGGIVGQGTGTFDFGALPVTLNAPIYMADTGSAQTIQTTSTLNLNSAAGTAFALAPVGGALSFIGGTLNDNGATIEAPAGNVSLEAKTGNLTVDSGSLISSAGVSKQFFDQTEFAPAGAITLTADTGIVDVQAGSTLDFSGANGGGAAGSLTLSAPVQQVNLNGTLKGNAASGFAGGSFVLNTGGAVDLDQLSTELASSGVDNTITVQSNTGNLLLSAGNTLTANVVSLTADGGAGGQDPNNGNVQILGTINASGTAGGQIGLYGTSGVDVEGSLLATASDPSQRGGTVAIDTTGTPGSTVTLNGTYGYENISSANSGVITVGANAKIDVSGGTADGSLGGTVSFRAPLLDSGDVNVSIAPTAQISGARSVDVEAYVVWSATDPLGAGGLAQHFDGVIDPAGWYDNNGNLLAGTFTTPSGQVINYTPGSLTADQLAADLTNDFFTPMTANVNHETFYGYVNGNTTTPGTLMGFIENGLGATPVFASRFANIANFQAVPGVELDNPTTANNSGNISILSNWNLGAGQPNNVGSITPAYRYQGSIAPILTFRAVGDVVVDASITDGFYQNQVATILGGAAPSGGNGSTTTFATAETLFDSLSSADSTVRTITFTDGTSQLLTALGTNGQPLDPNAVLAAPLTGQSSDYYTDYVSYANAWGTDYTDWGVANKTGNHIIPINTSATSLAVSTSPNAATAASYAAYLTLYTAYLNTLTRPNAATFGTPVALTLSTVATDYPAYIAAYNAYLTKVTGLTSESITGTKFNFFYDPAAPLSIPATGDNIGVLPGNAPSNVSTANNPLPLDFATLMGGQSSSYRVVAGADLSSANPLALQASSIFGTGGTLAGSGDVTLNDHTAYVDSNELTLLEPTMIRTGTGSIDIAAGNDIALLDSIAPGVIYTAGVSAPGAPAGNPASIVKGLASQGVPDILVTPTVNPESGGDISINAQGNIIGIEDVIDTTGAVTGVADKSISQFWWQWMEIGNPTGLVGSATQTIQTSIDFGAFDQGVMSVGGNVSVSAGGNITDLAVSLPTTWYLNSNNTPVTVGGGNLSVTAGGNILSGDYFVANGIGTIKAGGLIGADLNIDNASGQPAPVSTLLATQSGILDLSARQGANIGGVFDPSLIESTTLTSVYHQQPDGQGYSSNSAVNVESATANVDLGTLDALPFIGDNASSVSLTLPATVSLTAFTGGITVASGATLASSPIGNLNLIADQSINFNGQNGGTTFGMSGTDPSSIDETNPVHIYSLTGSIVDGVLEPAGSGGNAGFYDDLLGISVDKPALIEAGQDIINLAFQGQNLRDSDVTRIIAGRDIEDTPLPLNAKVIPSLQLGGPGYFDIEAGRNIGPLTSQAQAFDSLGSRFPTATGIATGIDAVGNANNPSLPHESANVQVLFGVGPGIDDVSFIANYINPANSVAGVPSTTPALITFMEQYNAGQTFDTGLVAQQPALKPLTASQAWAQFQALPTYVQQLFVEQVFFSVLTDVGNDFNNQSSPFFNQYGRGFQAINTLFPASLGYTANDLGGGTNGANAPVQTGNLDIRSTTIQTQQGGNISILGPGGEALVGSSSAPPAIVSGNQVIAGPGTQGILTFEQGNIDIFTDQSLLLAQSRVFTEQGGDMTIWSSNGNIDAGKGSTTVADIPPPEYVCDVNHFCTVDAKGEVTGAGIATLQTIPGATVGDVNLLAPRGTVDAGAAGIRVSGNLNIAALKVLNADNIQVQGKSTGVPAVSAVDTGALTAASAATSAVTQMAQTIARNNAGGVSQRHWIITVEVEGFGDASDDDNNGSKKKRKGEAVSYNPNSYLQVVGHGPLNAQQLTNMAESAHLSDAERRSVEQNQ